MDETSEERENAEGLVPATAMKSHTPECAKIEQFAGTLVPVKSNVVCLQDFDTKDYMLEIRGRFIIITKEQFDDGTWREIVRRAFQ